MASERTTVESRRIGAQHEQTVRRIEPDGSETVQTSTFPTLPTLIDENAFSMVFGSDRGHELVLSERSKADHR